MERIADPEFRALFDECFEPMRRLAHLLGADDPEDIAQEAFVRLHARWGQVDVPLGYLRRTVVNLSRSRLRHLRLVRRHARVVEGPDAAGRADASAPPTADPALGRALAALSRRQRQVVVLRFWLDLDVATTASVLGLAPGTVKATTHHAMTALRRALAEQPGEDLEVRP